MELGYGGCQDYSYTTRFHELSRLVPHMVTPEYKRVERYIWGLSPKIRSMVTASAPATIQSTVTLAHSLTDDAIRTGTLGKKESSGDNSGHKRQHSDSRRGRNSNSSNKRQGHDTGFCFHCCKRAQKEVQWATPLLQQVQLPPRGHLQEYFVPELQEARPSDC